MKRLRHPIRLIREPFGTAGLIVAMIALLAALGGTALAANGALSGKQKKEVEKIAKKYAGKPGSPGAAGAPGAKGDAGVNGSNGSNGGAGANGISVTTSAASGAECPAGGIKIASAGPTTKVCNGTTGFTEVLPAGKTETGIWSSGIVSEIGNENIQTAISFAIPLAMALPVADTHYLTTVQQQAGGTTQCPGTVDEPLAAEGNLCVYQGATRLEEEEAGEEFKVSGIFPASEEVTGAGGASTAGAILFIHYKGFPETASAYLNGSWALTGS
jgi:hypothetical protein